MSNPDRSDVTALLRAHSAGSKEALDSAIQLIYEELRGLAAAQLVAERQGHTLGATALVHEAYVRLVDIREVEWSDRVHFFAVAARLMRRVLVDHGRARNANKRGGGAVHLPLSDAIGVSTVSPEELITFDALLDRLAELDGRKAQVVECRCFAGLSIDETARALDTSPATVKRDWAFARAWLNREAAGATDSSKAAP